VLNSGIRSLLHDPPIPPTTVDALERSEAQVAPAIDTTLESPPAEGSDAATDSDIDRA
jgi:hypothetical protein